MATPRKPVEVPFEKIELMFRLAGYYLGHNYKPPVFRSGGGYGIRILARQTATMQGINTTYDYFDVNADGIVTASPRGWASQFNRKRITGLAEALEKYATLDGGDSR